MVRYNEEIILKSKDPHCHEDEWDEIPLSNVEVFDGKTHKLKSLIHANEELPLLVTGKLGALPVELRHLVLDRASLPTLITIHNVERFAYGQYDDGEAIFWAAGKAGWYKLKPARSYRSIFKSMEEAIKVLFFTSDFYREAKTKKQRQTPVEEIFAQYMEQPKTGCSDIEDVAKVYKRHRQFLLESMSKGKEGINWKGTSIYEYMLQQPSSGSSSSSDSDTEELSDTSNVPVVGRGKSALRPRSGKYSTKSSGRRRDPSEMAAMDLEEDSSAILPAKRKSRSTSRGDRARKRAQTLDSSDMDSPLLSQDETDSSTPTNTKLPLREKPIMQMTRTEEPSVDIVRELLPSYEPQGPGDTWYCTFDGCSHRIYGARSSESKQLIKEHFRTHAQESQLQLDLIYKEERPYLPVSNLIRRIRDMATLQVGSPASKDLFPKPIERRS